MDKVDDENAEKVKQAWRKKPRKFAPKSRLGCKTCKIRRIKCDLSQPSCSKCLSTGRTCDGYGGSPSASNSEHEQSQYPEKTNKAETFGNEHRRIAMNAFQPSHSYKGHHSPMSQDLGPFMILPVTGSAQTEAMCFFEYISIKHLTEYHPSKSWRETLMYFCQTVPSVRYAAIALALTHRSYLERDSGGRTHQPQPLEDWLPDKAPLMYYNRAIQLLLEQKLGDSTEETAVTLLVCYLFTCFDHLTGNYVQAIRHIRGGVELLRNIDKSIVNITHATDDSNPSRRPLTLLYQIARQIRRLDLQAVAFLVDWTPADVQDTLSSRSPSPDSAFHSLDQAADHIQVLVARVMSLRNAGYQVPQMGETEPPISSSKGAILEQLETWSSLFENMLQQRSPSGTDPAAYPLISLLRLHHTIMWTLVNCHGPGEEMEYDNFLPQFQQCVALAAVVAEAREQYSGSFMPTFTPEVGILPVLYIIGVKCRHPMVRREVLSILRRHPIREAVWDSTIAARVVERAIEIEEGEFGEGRTVQSMEEIPVWQRIEDMSWVHVVSGESAPRVDLRYSFSSREEMHVEPLML